MSYEETLLAYGIPADQAMRDAWANEVLRFRNRDSDFYGMTEDDLRRRTDAARSIA